MPPKALAQIFVLVIICAICNCVYSQRVNFNDISTSTFSPPITNQIARKVTSLWTWWAKRRKETQELVKNHPLHTVDIIKRYGLNYESYEVTTEDGFILDLYRIPPQVTISRGEKLPEPKLPVLLAHGNFQSSAEWLINTPKNASLGFMLADLGYDVWLLNTRGTIYSKHKQFTKFDRRFWNFTFHEMGIYDMPAHIDFILSHTGCGKLHFVTVSMGPAGFLAGLTLKPEYNDKIASAHLLGPTVFMANFYNGLSYYLSAGSIFLSVYLRLFGSAPIIPHSTGRLMSFVYPRLCNPKVDVTSYCRNLLYLNYGVDGGLLTQQQVAELFRTTPAAGSSLKLLNHAMQLWRSRGFHEYDYGVAKNLMVYGTRRPPDYDLSKATVPTALYVGLYDFMGHREDVKFLSRKLPNVIDFFVSPHKEFNHINFVYGREPAAEVYRRVISNIRKYERNETSCGR